MGRKRSKAVRKAKKAACEPEEITKAPHSFVIPRGKLGKNATELMLNFRKLMEPYTASHLKVRRQNVVKDFVHIAGVFNVSHLVIFTKTKKAMYFRVAKLPRGPTLTYQIKEYSLMKDVISSQRKPVMYEKLFRQYPLLVLNNFSGEGMHFKLMASMLQSMFPSINVNKANLNTIRRCILFHYNEDKTIDMRQYAVKIVPVGISKAVKRLIQSKVPDLSHYQTVDEFLQKSGNLSESEVEIDVAANVVTLPQPISTRGNIASEKSAVRLFEIGPRMQLQLLKIEEGLMNGEVMFHELFKRTPEEISALKERLRAKKLLKEKRRAVQKQNVERKKKVGNQTKPDNNDDVNDKQEDLEWYRKEVGEDPDEDMLNRPCKRKLGYSSERPVKIRKTEQQQGKEWGKGKKHQRSSSMRSIKGRKTEQQQGKEWENGKEHKKRKETEKKVTFQDFLKQRRRKKEAKLNQKKKKLQPNKKKLPPKVKTTEKRI